MYNNNIKNIKLAQENDDKALEDLMKNNSGLIWNIVKRFTGRGYETEDLYQIGCIGLIKAIKRFDINLDVQLSTYAVPYIMGEIKRFIRDDGLITEAEYKKKNLPYGRFYFHKNYAFPKYPLRKRHVSAKLSFLVAFTL